MANMQYARRIRYSPLIACSAERTSICYRLAHISARIWLEHTLSKWSCLGDLLLQQPTNNTPRHQGIVKALSEVLQVPSKPAHHNTRIKAQKGPEREGGPKQRNASRSKSSLSPRPLLPKNQMHESQQRPESTKQTVPSSKGGCSYIRKHYSDRTRALSGGERERDLCYIKEKS